MTLTKEQRRRLLKGDYTPLHFHDQPIAGPCCVVLTWSRQQRAHDGDGGRYTIPRQAVRWIEVTSIKRHRKGGWQVRFDVTDLRQTQRYLRSTPPVWDPHGNTAPDPLKESDRSSYTTSRWASIDELEVVPEKWQKAQSKTAYVHDDALRRERVAAAQQDRWSFRRERQRVARAMKSAA